MADIDYGKSGFLFSSDRLATGRLQRHESQGYQREPIVVQTHGWHQRPTTQMSDDVTSFTEKRQGDPFGGNDYRFRNDISDSDSASKSGLTREKRQQTASSTDRSISAIRSKRGRHLIWPIMLVTLPIAIVSAGLLLLVLGYRVRTEASIFAGKADQIKDNSAILVNYSATRIVFAASLLSTLAPILSTFIMALWSLPLARCMRTASLGHELLALPTPYQLSLVIGLTLASTERLRAYFGYLCSKSRKASIPPVLHRAAMMLSLSLLLAAAVFVADVALHYTTSTIEFDQISRSSEPNHDFGRGLSHRCLSFDRNVNGGFPCSFPANLPEANETVNQAIFEQNEIIRLMQNTSRQSEVRFFDSPKVNASHLAVLVPSQDQLSSSLDFYASTIAIATTCSVITPQCRMKYTDSTESLTSFSCSEDFYGILGSSVTIEESGASSAANSSALMYNPATNIDYAFYSDPHLLKLYNSVGYDPATLEATEPSLTDKQLVNTLYLGFAARYPITWEAAYVNLHEQIGYYAPVDPSIVDFAIKCEISSYDANYSWVAGDIDDVSVSLAPNGTILELFHGREFYGSLDAGADLQTILSQAILADSKTDFEQMWADWYSTKALSTIGPYMSSRKTLQEQSRTRLLVARVPKAALGALIACSLAYTVLGVVLGIAAYKASSADTRDLTAQLSLAGLTAAAFDSGHQSPSRGPTELEGRLAFDREQTGHAPRRVVVDGSPDDGYGFRAWV